MAKRLRQKKQPARPGRRILPIVFDENQYQLIEERARHEGTSRSGWVRQAVVQKLAKAAVQQLKRAMADAPVKAAS